MSKHGGNRKLSAMWRHVKPLSGVIFSLSAKFSSETSLSVSVLYSADRLMSSNGIRRRNIAKGACQCLCYAAPPPVVGGAHNSPIANATMILKTGLVHYRLHLYNQSGVFYFPWHRHQVEGTYDF